MNTSQNLHKPTTPALRAFLANEAIQPLGFRRDGRPIYPIAGGAPDGGDGAGDGGQGGDGGGQNGGSGSGDGGQGGGQGAGGTGGQGDSSQGANGDQQGQQQDAQKVEDLPDWAQKLIRDTRKEAGDRRTALTQAEKQQQEIVKAFAKAAGIELPGDDGQQPNPDELTQQLTQTQQQARQAAVELAVYKTAGKHSGDPDALLDSRSFLDAVKDLDPAADDFAAKVDTAVKTAVEANPKLKAGRAPGASSADHAGGTGDHTRRTSSKPLSIDQAVSSHYGT